MGRSTRHEVMVRHSKIVTSRIEIHDVVASAVYRHRRGREPWKGKKTKSQGCEGGEVSLGLSGSAADNVDVTAPATLLPSLLTLAFFPWIQRNQTNKFSLHQGCNFCERILPQPPDALTLEANRQRHSCAKEDPRKPPSPRTNASDIPTLFFSDSASALSTRAANDASYLLNAPVAYSHGLSDREPAAAYLVNQDQQMAGEEWYW